MLHLVLSNIEEAGDLILSAFKKKFQGKNYMFQCYVYIYTLSVGNRTTDIDGLSCCIRNLVTCVLWPGSYKVLKESWQIGLVGNPRIKPGK